MKILLTGKDGQIGYDLQNTLLPFGEVIAVSRHDLDLANSNVIRQFIEQIKPDMIINPAAYTNVDRAESEIELAYQVNAEAPKVLAEMAAELNIPLIHFSTDYVFDGLKKEPYIETDKTNPLSVYAKTKCAGEKAISKYEKHIILRTSWVFSSRGHNFLKTVLKLIQERESLSIVSDQKGSPTSSLMLANITCKIVKKIFDDNNFKDFGVYHVASEGYTDWHKYAIFINEEAIRLGLKSKIKSLDIHAVSSREYPSIAIRPNNSMLNTDKIKVIFNEKLPFWQDEVKKTLKEIAST
jgi:dTDP-4-dehydrorhamnose reductase